MRIKIYFPLSFKDSKYLNYNKVSHMLIFNLNGDLEGT